jgi:putative flippase GtrA
MIKIRRQFEPLRFLRFLAAGGIAASTNILVRWLLSFVMVYEAAIACSYLTGMAAAFLLMRRLVFAPGSGTIFGQFGRFAMVNAVSFSQVWLISVGLARIVFPAIGLVWQSETVAHIIGVLSPAVTSYLLHKQFSFARTRASAGRPPT